MSYENLFVTKLPREITDADLLALFSAYKPQSAKIMLDAATGKSKGFGFVLFDSADEGFRAYSELNQVMVQYKIFSFPLVIYPSKHDGKIVNKANRALYIRNIPLNLPQDDVVQFLRRFGNVSYFAMREGNDGNSVWVVYAEYETIEEAENALGKIHGSAHFFPGSLPLLAKFADTDDAKRARRLRRESAREAANNNGSTGTGVEQGMEQSHLLSPSRPSLSLPVMTPSPPFAAGGSMLLPQVPKPVSPVSSSVGNFSSSPISSLEASGNPSNGTVTYVLQQVLYGPPVLSESPSISQPLFQSSTHAFSPAPHTFQSQSPFQSQSQSLSLAQYQPMQFLTPVVSPTMPVLTQAQPGFSYYVQ